MKTSTKLIATAAASVCGLALAVGGAQAASGSPTAPGALGHVVQVSGVVPASAPASTTPVAYPATHAERHETHTTAGRVARSYAQPRPASREHRSDCGWDSGHSGWGGSGWRTR